MKRLGSALSFLIFALPVCGQFGHEWIRIDQPYFKISVARAALYRISFEDLQNAGLNASADPKTIQIFHRGKEQAIIVKGEEDNRFDAVDYIEFYGRPNDGILDSTLYPASQPHKLYNLFTDTTSYFLTYGSVNGKRATSFIASPSGVSEAAYHWCEKILLLTGNYSAGIDHGNVHQTFFDEGEGWTGAQILHNSQLTYAIPGITETFTSADKPSVEILLTGRGPMTHEVEIYVGSRLLSTVSFTGYQSYKHTQPLEWSDIPGDGIVNFTIKVTGTSGPDRVSGSYIRLIFPQLISMSASSDKVFGLPVNADGQTYIKIKNPLPDTRLFDVTDPSAVIQIQAEASATLNAVVSSTGTSRKILASNTYVSPKVKRVFFRQISSSRHNYVIITHPKLRGPALGYIDPVKAYAEYRALPEGGSYDTLIVNIDQLYDQFNYGEKSPRAIFQFMKYLASGKLPGYLFLIGKGLDVAYGYGRNPSVFMTYQDLVPSAGSPGSDMAYTAGLGGDAFVAGVPTGRLTAMKPSEVALYLNKIKETEARAFTDLKRKNILHLSGGIEENEPARFRSILQGFETVAEQVYLGGKVQAIGKQTIDSKVINIADEVNNGLGLITFFGHSAPTTLDFDIGLVSDPVMGYNNTGKYPVLLMNGCDAGAFFLNASIFGENWINTPDKGAVGFIAHSAYGLTNSLSIYTSLFYQVAFGDSVFIKKGLGDVQREVARRFLAIHGDIPLYVTQSQQMVLLGDPALRLFGAKNPDYEVQENSVFISNADGQPITAQTSFFNINIPIRNFGIAKNEKLRLEIKRKLNDNSEVVYDTIIQSTLYSDTIVVAVPNSIDNPFGNNVFSVTVDADNLSEELNEENNSIVYEYFIPLNGTKNLFPYDYSIVSAADVSLSFQYANAGSVSRDYILEIDTLDTFDSPFKKTFELSAKILAKQTVQLLSTDTLVYYWRTKIAQPVTNESVDWTVSSFTYINNGDEGWAQAHFPQFSQNRTFGLVKDPELRRIRFEETVSDLAIKTFSSASGMPLDSVSFKINGAEFNLRYEGGACRNNTINLVAFDRKSTQPYAGLYFKWYEILYEYGGRRLLCGREPYVINSFAPAELVTGNQDDLIQYIDNIHLGDSVLLFSMGDAGFSLWPEMAKTKLAEVGISTAQLADLQDGQPVIIMGRKGSSPGGARILHSPAPETSLRVNKTLTGRFTSGSMASVVIGPAQRWDRVIVQFAENESVDQFSYDVVGVKPDGGYDTLQRHLNSTTDLSSFNAADYPQLLVVFNSTDDVNLTSVQIKKWLVLYEPVAEGLTFYKGTYAQQVLFEGQTLFSDFGFLNISDKIFSDSLLVRYEVINDDAGSDPSILKIKAPAPGDTTLFRVPFNTESRPGINDVEVYVNPRIIQEKFFDNNAIRLRDHLNVLTDEKNPVMDVTVDGRHLVNDDFVSADPVIVVRLWDENPYLLKQDTMDVNIFLAYPCASGDCVFERIHFSRGDVTWYAATENSDFNLHFQPMGLPEGMYRLRVEAKDTKGNESGEEAYEVTFKVESESAVFVSLPYPNPFNIETNFDITLTGLEASSHYELRLLTLNGVEIQKHTSNALPLHIGKNSLRWNGLDNKNNPLPNGIYLYKLSIDSRGKREEFLGKIILIR